MNTISSISARRRAHVLAVLAGLAWTASAHAQMPPVIRLYPPGGGWFEHTFTQTTSNTVPMQIVFGYNLYAYADIVTAGVKCVAPGSGATGPIITPPLGPGLFQPPGKIVTVPPATADAWARVNVLTLIPGKVVARYGVRGRAVADHNGCFQPQVPAPPPFGTSYAKAWSKANVGVRGGKKDAKGNIKFGGNYRFGVPVFGTTEARAGTDPIRARLIDHTTGVTQDFMLMSFVATAAAGEVAWESETLSNSGADCFIDIYVPGTRTVQSGRLLFRVAGGVVTTRELTGMFSQVPLPPLFGGGMFSVPLPDISLDYDLGGDETHDLSAEFTYESGAETDAAVACYVITNGSLLTEIGTAPGGDNLSRVPPGDSVYGFSAAAGVAHIADNFTLFGGANWLEALHWPIYQIDAPAETPVSAAYVRIWAGAPGAGGVPVGGDMVTNRLIESPNDHCHRVGAPSPNTRAIKNMVLDLTGIGPLPPGAYWVEVAVQGAPGFGTPWTPPSIWPRPTDNALHYSASTNTWTPIQDTASGRTVDVPFRLFIGDQPPPPPPCYPDCNHDSVLTIADFGCFQMKFVSGDPYADCNHTGSLTIADFGCFQSSFVQGCP